MTELKRNADGVYIVYTQYACGSEVGFATRDIEVAARRAAEIMTDVCPECKQAMGEPLTDDERRMLAMNVNKTLHREGSQN